jgi:hypothetical protein
MARATVLVLADLARDWDLATRWIEEWRHRIDVCPEEPGGCLYRVAWWEVDAPQEAIDELPGRLLASSEWVTSGRRAPDEAT